MAELRDWSVTAVSNNDTSPDGFPENMQFSEVNNSAREVMAVLARHRQDTSGELTTTGTGAALVLTTSGTYSPLRTGDRFSFAAHVDIEDDATLQVNSEPAVSIVDASGANINGGLIEADEIVDVVYDGASFRIQNFLNSFYLPTGALNRYYTTASGVFEWPTLWEGTDTAILVFQGGDGGGGGGGGSGNSTSNGSGDDGGGTSGGDGGSTGDHGSDGTNRGGGGGGANGGSNNTGFIGGDGAGNGGGLGGRGGTRSGTGGSGGGGGGGGGNDYLSGGTGGAGGLTGGGGGGENIGTDSNSNSKGSAGGDGGSFGTSSLGGGTGGAGGTATQRHSGGDGGIGLPSQWIVEIITGISAGDTFTITIGAGGNGGEGGEGETDGADGLSGGGGAAYIIPLF